MSIFRHRLRWQAVSPKAVDYDPATARPCGLETDSWMDDGPYSGTRTSRPAVARAAQRWRSRPRAGRGGGCACDSLTYNRRLIKPYEILDRSDGAHRGQCRPRAERRSASSPATMPRRCALEGCRCRGKGEPVHFPKGLCRGIAERHRATPQFNAAMPRNPAKSGRDRRQTNTWLRAGLRAAPRTKNLDGNRRYATFEDFRQFRKLS